MASERFTFGDFTLDPADRRLSRAGEAVELSSRYLDALTLLLRERGRLVTKDRFMDEVWRGVPVTDEALTQCIKTLRRQLGDDAARPQFIETVPKHGYRFIGEIVWDAGWVSSTSTARAASFDWLSVLRSGAAAGAGGAFAGLLAGLAYGLLAAPPSPEAAMGTASILMVLTAASIALGFAGGAGVGAGIALAGFAPSPKWQWSTAGGMFGGLLVGAVAKLLALDAFTLLFGRSPAGMTGPAEGALLGAALGLAAFVTQIREFDLRWTLAAGGTAGAGAGLLIPLLGGHLLGGSINLLAKFPDARFRLDAIGALLGEQGFGPVSEAATATVEGAVFGLCVLGALALGRRGGEIR